MTIYLAGNRLPVPGAELFGHLQLVFAGRELEVQTPLDGFGTWRFVARDHDGISDDGPNTPSFGESGYYAATSINIGERSDSELWSLLENVHGAFRAQSSIPYLLLDQNSNS